MSDSRYLRLFDYQTELICLYQPGGTLTYVNRAYCRFFGKEASELIGTQFVLPEDERSVVEQHLIATRHEDKELTLEYQVTNINGDIRWLHWTQRAILDEQGKVVEFVSIGRDITERKIAETGLNEYIDQISTLHQVDREMTRRLEIKHVLMIGLDLCVRLSGATVGFVAMFTDEGDLRMEKAVGRYPPELGVPYLDPNWGIVGRVIKRRKPERIPNIALVPAGRSVIPNVRGQMAFPLISQDRLLGVLCLETSNPEAFNQDTFDFLRLVMGRVSIAVHNAQLYEISQTQLAELQALYAKVSRLEQIKTDMIRIAAHDLRNPIGVIMGYMSLIRMRLWGQMTEQERDFMGRIQRAIERMERITKDILSLERIEQSAEPDFREQIDLREVIQQVYDDHLEQAQQKNLHFIQEFTESLLYVSGNQAQLVEAAANLVSNAIKYTPIDGRVIVRLDERDGKAVFNVEDSGYGIPDEMQQELFQPFYRARTSETESIEGTGLGLHLVKNIIERHHGTMQFHSTYGQGSTFGFELPLMRQT